MLRFMIVLLAVLTLAVAGFAADDAAEAKTEAKVVLKNQTHCPVMGGKIDSTVFTDIQGQRVYHCCAGCQGALKKDPDKFFQKAAADGILFENIQTVCPVSGKELEKKESMIDFEGRRVYFCCDGCIAPFKKEPAKFLAALDAKKVEEMPKDEAHKMSGEGHEGHGHK